MFVCIHVSGDDNVWADLLGRWSAPPSIRRIISVPPLVSSPSEEFEWPTAEAVCVLQQKHIAEKPDNLHPDEGLFVNDDGAAWVPDCADDFQLRICIAGHTGPAGHRGCAATVDAINKQFFWSSMRSDIRTFVKACIHCLSTVRGNKVPRPLGAAVQITSPNDLLQFGYIEMAPSNTGEKYVLMLRDDFSSYCWLVPFSSTKAENAADAIIEWVSSFLYPKGLMSDGPTHFKNETLRRVAKGLKMSHHFTLPYSPWSNGRIERLGREVLRAFRAILSELRMGSLEWSDIVPVVQSVLDGSPSASHKNLAPVTIFLGMQPTGPLSSFKRTKTCSITDATKAMNEIKDNLSASKDLLTELHTIVKGALVFSRNISREAASRGKAAKFTEGDFVLVARDEFFKGEKLALRWRGPRRVVKAVSDYVYTVEDLRNGSCSDVYARRLRFYADSSLDQESVMSHAIESETVMPVSKLLRLVKKDDQLFVTIRWKGLNESDDTDEPLKHVHEDLPRMLLKLLERKETPKQLAKETRAELGL